MTTDVTAATWLYFNPYKPGDLMGRGMDHPEHFTPLASYDGDGMSSSGLGYVSLKIGGVETIGISYYGSLDLYWGDLIEGLPNVLRGEKRYVSFSDMMGGGWMTPLEGGLIRFARDELSNGPDYVPAPAVTAVADRVALGTALADGAQGWHDFCERVAPSSGLAGPWMQERIDAVRAALAEPTPHSVRR